MRGATDAESLLLLFLDDCPEAEDFPRSLRHEDPPLLPDRIRRRDVDGNFVERCLNDLWTKGIQPTMIPIEISANLTKCSAHILYGRCRW